MLEAIFGKVDRLTQDNAADKMRRYQRNGTGQVTNGS